MDIEQMLKALGEPTRFKVFQHLLMRKHCIRSLSKKMGITESAVSQHMKILREAGLVYSVKYGYHKHYLPSQESLDLLSDAFFSMKAKSMKLDRTSGICNCELKEAEDKE